MMGLQILALEDRIVFDAVGAPDADPNHQADDVSVAFEPAAEPAPAIDAHDAVEATSATDASAAVETDVDPEADHAPLDHGGDVGTSAQDGVRVLVVSSAIDDADVLAEAARDNVITVTYDADTADMDTILSDIQDALAGEKADSIAFAVHGTEAGNFILARNQVVSLANLLESQDQQEFWQELSQSITDNGRIDIMACNLTASDTGQSLVTELENLTNRDVAASDDLTGNTAAGGDWILEAGNIDLAATYFDGDKLDEFSGTLPGWGPVTDFLNSDFSNVANYASGGTTLLDVGGDFAIVDLDNAGWDGGYLNVYISWHDNAGDELYFNNFGTYTVVGGATLNRGGTVIGSITGWHSTNLQITWNNNATTADVQNVTQHILFDPDNGGNGDTRDFQFEFRNAAGNSAWTWCQAAIDGPVLGNHLLSGYAEASTTILDTGDLNATDADVAGDVNIQFQLTEAAHNGLLQLNGVTLSSGDTFTKDDITNNRVQYVHASGDLMFDYIDFRITDTTNNQESREYTMYFNGTGDSSPTLDLDNWNAGNDRNRFMPYNVEMEELTWGCADDLSIADDNLYKIQTITINLTNRPDGGNEWIDLESWDRDRASGLYGISVTGGGGTSLTLSSGSPIDGKDFAEILSRVRYYHSAIGRTAGVRDIEVVANDGTGNNSNTAHWYIDVEPDSGRPVVADHFMQVHRGTTRVISGGNLKTLDSNTPASGLTYTIQSITWEGILYLNGSALGTGSTFTQAQVDAGQLSYQHTSGGSGWGWDSFNFKVSDGTNDTWGNMDLEIVPIDQPLWDQGGDGFAPGDMADMVEGFGDEGGFFGEMGGAFDTVQEAAQSLGQSLDRDQLDQDAIDADDVDNAMDMATRTVNDGWDTVLDAFGKNSEASSILGNAITEIRRAKVLYGQSDSTLGQAQSLLELYQGPVKEFLKELVQGMDNTTSTMNSAKSDLTALLHAAIGAGDRFDKAYGDAILSQVSNLTVDNDRVFIQESVLQSVVAQINEQGEDLNLERLRKIAAQAEKQAEQKIMAMHNLKDKAARDKVAASIDKLLNKQKITRPENKPAPKDQPAPTPKPGQVGDAGFDHDPAGDASLQRNNIFAEAGTLLSVMSFAGKTTADTNVNRHNQHSLESATTILEKTKATVSKDLLSSLINAARINRN